MLLRAPLPPPGPVCGCHSAWACLWPPGHLGLSLPPAALPSPPAAGVLTKLVAYFVAGLPFIVAGAVAYRQGGPLPAAGKRITTARLPWTHERPSTTPPSTLPWCSLASGKALSQGFVQALGNIYKIPGQWGVWLGGWLSLRAAAPLSLSRSVRPHLSDLSALAGTKVLGDTNFATTLVNNITWKV